MSERDGAETLLLPSTHREQTVSRVITLQELVRDAASIKYRSEIMFTAETGVDIARFWNNSQLRVVSSSGYPREVRRAIVDVYTKEFENRGANEEKTTVKVYKSQERPTGRCYEWFQSSGFLCDAHVGSHILDMAVGGEFRSMASVNAGSASQSVNGYIYLYNQKEELTVPCNSKVKAVVSTSSVKYEVDYTIEIGVHKSTFVRFRYLNCLQRYLCCCCSSRGYVSANDVLRQLPSYREDDQWAYFQQNGKLSWTGEAGHVTKVQQAL